MRIRKNETEPIQVRNINNSDRTVALETALHYMEHKSDTMPADIIMLKRLCSNIPSFRNKRLSKAFINCK